MAVDADQFRKDFPAFIDEVRYPTGLLTYWLSYAYGLLNADAFATMLDSAAELYTAHNIVLERRAMDEAAGGNPGSAPGYATGPIASKGANGVSVSYTNDAAIADGGNFNLTNYGIRLLDLINLFGAGPIQANVGCAPPFTMGAWNGPPPWPGWFV